MYLHALSTADEIKPKLLKEKGYNYAHIRDVGSGNHGNLQSWLLVENVNKLSF